MAAYPKLESSESASKHATIGAKQFTAGNQWIEQDDLFTQRIKTNKTCIRGNVIPMRIITCLIFLTRLLLVIGPPVSHASELNFGNAPTLSHSEMLWLENHPVVTLAFDGYFPPYSFLNDHGDLEGVSVDVAKIIEKKTGDRIFCLPAIHLGQCIRGRKSKTGRSCCNNGR